MIKFIFFKGSSQYRAGCPNENITCLSIVGILFTIIFTYLGFFLLFWGTLWNANILTKIKEVKKKWKQLRNHSK